MYAAAGLSTSLLLFDLSSIIVRVSRRLVTVWLCSVPDVSSRCSAYVTLLCAMFSVDCYGMGLAGSSVGWAVYHAVTRSHSEWRLWVRCCMIIGTVGVMYATLCCIWQSARSVSGPGCWRALRYIASVSIVVTCHGHHVCCGVIYAVVRQFHYQMLHAVSPRLLA